MTFLPSLLAAVAWATPQDASPAMPVPEAETSGLVAVRVGRAETISHGSIEHAVVLVENGKIVTIGQDLPVDRGIPVISRPDWVAMPGLVVADSALGLDSMRGGDIAPSRDSKALVLPRNPAYGDALESGITTLGLMHGASSGIPGHAIVVRPHGDTLEEMLLSDNAYIRTYFQSNSKAKKIFADGFEKVEDYWEKEEKEREKYDKAVEKNKKADDEDKKEIGPYEPPKLDPDTAAFMDLLEGKTRSLISISKSGDYLHLLDAVDDLEFAWDLKMNISTGANDFNYIVDRVGERGLRVVCAPNISLMINSMRQRNLPAELSRAGADLVLIPRSTTSLQAHEGWRSDVGEIVGQGLDADVALRAMTLGPAEVLGVADRVGSLQSGKDANILFLNGDPFEPTTRVQAVMLEGEFVGGDLEW